MRSGPGAHQHNTLQPSEETRQKRDKPSCFNFSSGFGVLLFDFSPAYGGDYMIRACRGEISTGPAETDFALR